MGRMAGSLERGKWKKNSKTAQKNRNSEVAGAGTGVTKHTAGSRSIIEHTLKLEEDLQRRADCWEVFRTTHRHKDDTFVDARSKALDDEITARVTEVSQGATERGEPHIPSPDYINNIFYEATGGMKKSRIYGLGSQAKVMFPHAMSTSRGMGRPSSSSAEIEELRAENEELRARMATLDESKAENVELKARMAALEGSMRAFMSRMLSQPLASSSAFPDFSSPIVDSDETQPSPPHK